MWRVIQSAKIMQSTTNPCKTAILAGGKLYAIGEGGATSWNNLTDRPFGEEVKT